MPETRPPVPTRDDLLRSLDLAERDLEILLRYCKRLERMNQELKKLRDRIHETNLN